MTGQKHIYESVENAITLLSERCRSIEKVCSTLMNLVANENCLVPSSRFLRNDICVRFARDLRNIDTDAYDRLVKGLDEDSAVTVSRILARIQGLSGASDGELHDLMSPWEKTEYRDMLKKFSHARVKLAEDCYAWGKYKLPTKHFEPGTLFFRHGISKLAYPGRCADKDIIDAGAFIGDSALILSEYTERSVHSFEPVSGNYENMLKTLAMNKLRNVIPVRSALGEEKGVMSLVANGSASHAGKPGKGQETEEVRVCRLDDYVEEHSLTVGLIKADLEGGEQGFLRGARKTIQRDRPALIISIYHTVADFFTIKCMLEAWKLGYAFQVYSPPGSILLETVLIAECRDS